MNVLQDIGYAFRDTKYVLGDTKSSLWDTNDVRSVGHCCPSGHEKYPSGYKKLRFVPWDTINARWDVNNLLDITNVFEVHQEKTVILNELKIVMMTCSQTNTCEV